MCAIKPAHKKRIILDVYTSDTRVTKEEFEDMVYRECLRMEIRFNSTTGLRWHVKETKQKAD